MFCGWIDIPLLEKGNEEAPHAGELLLNHGIKPTMMYTSMLQRPIKTGYIILETIGRMWIPHVKCWRLNERHYGAFQGRDKREVYREYGKDKYQCCRRNFHAVPPLAKAQNEPSIDERHEGLLGTKAPSGESLETTMQRLVPYVEENIVIQRILADNETVLVVTHGLIVRSLIKHFCRVSDENISTINAPTGVALVFGLVDGGKLIGNCIWHAKAWWDRIALRPSAERGPTFSHQRHFRSYGPGPELSQGSPKTPVPQQNGNFRMIWLEDAHRVLPLSLEFSQMQEIG